MNKYFMVTWYQGEEWYQSGMILHGHEAIEEFNKHRDNPEHTGVRLWEMDAIKGVDNG